MRKQLAKISLAFAVTAIVCLSIAILTGTATRFVLDFVLIIINSIIVGADLAVLHYE